MLNYDDLCAQQPFFFIDKMILEAIKRLLNNPLYWKTFITQKMDFKL